MKVAWLTMLYWYQFNCLKTRLNPSVTVSYRPSWINILFLNTKKHPTDNIWVEEQLPSMDREAIAKYVYRDSGTEAAGIVPKNMPLFSPPDSLIPF